MNEQKDGKYIRFIRLYCRLYKKGWKRVARLLYWANRFIFSCDIPPTVVFGKNLILPHFGLGVVIHYRTIMGDNVKIFQNVTIGVRKPGKSSVTIIGNNVMIGAGAKVLSYGELKIGDNAQIGANSVVLHDVNHDTIVAGIPAKDIN